MRQQLSPAAQQRVRAAATMIPGAGPVNWLHNLVPQAPQAPPTPRQQALQQQNAQRLRRSRLAQQLQNDNASRGRAPLSQREVDDHLATIGY